MRAGLERNGWVTGPAQVYDFWCARAGVRAFVKLGHHEWGVQVAVKVKPGLLLGAEKFLRDLWEAGRRRRWAQPLPASTYNPVPARADKL